MTSTNIPVSAPNLESYLRVHRLLRLSAGELAEATAAGLTSQSSPIDRALSRWYRGFADEIRCHHHIEDALLFPALRARVATYGEYAARLDADHAGLDVILDGLGEALRSADRATAASLAAELRDHLDEHLGYEDDEIAPLFARHFTAIEFEALNAKAVRMTSPKQLIFTAPWLMSYLDESERRELLASVPKAMTLLWILTRRRYARLTVQAFAAVRPAFS